MPVSVAISLLAAVIAVGCYIFAGFGKANSENLILVATTAFNAAAILCLFWIFFKHRDDPPARFGRVARENISTIVVSLMIGLIFTGLSLAASFGISPG